MIIALVLRGGGEYQVNHVSHMVTALRAHAPEATLLLLSDDVRARETGVDVVMPLRHEWRGWWAKMELFRPDLPGDFLYLDLDTMVVGDLSPLLATTRLTLLRDFYRPLGLGSGLMRVPTMCRAAVWEDWMRKPAYWMARLRGDQDFLELHWLREAARWQDLLPGQVVSYKVDVLPQGGVVSPEARVVCFHGRPRPWATSLWRAA